LRRCLIVLESFAYPSGWAGSYTRSWLGLSDRPLAAWAGFCENDRSGYAGLLAVACPTVATVNNHMPRLLAPLDHAAWLDGVGPLSLSAPQAESDYYHDNFGERWSTGALWDDPQAKARGHSLRATCRD